MSTLEQVKSSKTNTLEEVYFDDTLGSYLGCVDCHSDDDNEVVPANEDAFDLLSGQTFVPPENQTVVSSPSVPRVNETFRHRVYDFRVMPAWAYQFTVPPPMVPLELLYEDPVTEVAGVADLTDVAGCEDDCWNASCTSRTPAACVRPAVPLEEPTALEPEEFRTRPRPSRAAPPTTKGVMCCYWKQGSCSMGAACWYSHSGSPDTPCHYGVTCRKGHRDLVRSDSLVAKDARTVPEPTLTPAGVPRRYVHEPRTNRPSAPLVTTDLPCPHCGETAVSTQEFPYFEGGVRMRTALRGHCNCCNRTFMLA